MKLGLHITQFPWPLAEVGQKLRDIAQAADQGGFASLSVMDHFYQVSLFGAVDEPMFEAYTTLTHLAAATTRIAIGPIVSGITWRHPGVLVKQATALDVLSGGRAFLGLGAAVFEAEHKGLGVPFPPVKERFERLEEALQIVHQMWSGSGGAFNGRYYKLADTLNAPQCLSKPHPPILIGGNGERRTLKLVAQYADACNVQGPPEHFPHKFEVLRRHCDDAGRSFDAIERTAMLHIDVADGPADADQLVETLTHYAGQGVQRGILVVKGMQDPAPVELISRNVLPRIAEL